MQVGWPRGAENKKENEDEGAGSVGRCLDGEPSAYEIASGTSTRGSPTSNAGQLSRQNPGRHPAISSFAVAAECTPVQPRLNRRRSDGDVQSCRRVTAFSGGGRASVRASMHAPTRTYSMLLIALLEIEQDPL